MTIRAIRLRSRVLALTTVYAAMLIGIVLLLTWRARIAQERSEDFVAIDVAMASSLDELIRQQSAYVSHWNALADSSTAELRSFAARYRTVKQWTEVEPLRSHAPPDLHAAVNRFATTAGRLGRTWDTLGPAGRSASLDLLERQSTAIIATARRELDVRRERIREGLPRLRRAAGNTIWIAGAIAYIIAVLAFASARLTLARVVRPLENLSRAAERLAAGEDVVRAPVTGDREIAQLAVQFNRMADEIARAKRQLVQTARTDELTSLPNFRAFREALEREIRRALRQQKPFGLLLLDIDHFKAFNDRHGHPAGNLAIQAVARALREALRADDLPARYGGEELAAILPNLEVRELSVVAERVRASIEALPPVIADSAITVSVGGAMFPSDGDDADSLLAAADRRLYAAKAGGRNRCVAADEPHTV